MTEETRQRRLAENEIEYVAYRLIGDEDFELKEFINRSELNRFFDRHQTATIPANHRIHMSNLKDSWFVFRSKEKISYIQAVLERRI